MELNGDTHTNKSRYGNKNGYGNYPIEQIRIWFKELTTEDNFIILGKVDK